ADPERADPERADPERADNDVATRYRMPTTAELGWSVQHIDLAA
ncbi:MAG: hypothetical protein ACI83Y_002718, partial [Candidatus Azotimanducaceae bacterium]